MVLLAQHDPCASVRPRTIRDSVEIMQTRISMTPGGALVPLPATLRQGLRSAAGSPTGTIEVEGPWSDAVHFAVCAQMKRMSADAQGAKPHYAADGLAGRGFIKRFQIRAGGGMAPRYSVELKMTGPPARLGGREFR